MILIDHWLEERGVILELSTRMKTMMELAKFSHEIQSAGLIIDQMTSHSLVLKLSPSTRNTYSLKQTEQNSPTALMTYKEKV